MCVRAHRDVFFQPLSGTRKTLHVFSPDGDTFVALRVGVNSARSKLVKLTTRRRDERQLAFVRKSMRAETKAAVLQLDLPLSLENPIRVVTLQNLLRPTKWLCDELVNAFCELYRNDVNVVLSTYLRDKPGSVVNRRLCTTGGLTLSDCLACAQVSDKNSWRWRSARTCVYVYADCVCAVERGRGALGAR